MLSQSGAQIVPIGLESPEQLGITERHGGLWKALARRVISAKRVHGPEQMRIMMYEVTNVKNEQSRYGGYAPAQWVLGRNPNHPGGRFDEDNYADMGIISSKLDPNGAYALQQSYRPAARKHFVKVDCGKRVARAVQRKAAPVIGWSVTAESKMLRHPKIYGRQHENHRLRRTKDCLVIN